MSVSAPCPPDHPLMIAWNAYKATEEYPNTKKWAAYSEHVEGSLWAAFMAGFEAQKGSLSESVDLLAMAEHALTSYQYGNSAPELAEEVVAKLKAHRGAPK